MLPPLPWLEPGDSFPPPEARWGPESPAPGLLAAGLDLSTPTLIRAYSQGIFPWFSDGQPILWWHTDPRMVLRSNRFRLSDSLRKLIRSERKKGNLTIRVDSAFSRVIRACALTPRAGQSGSWITSDMVSAYEQLHRHGHAHSVEVWWDGELAGGLYAVNVGRMVFGESMFTARSNASKIALTALVSFCRQQGLPWIDCQQVTRHLASLGAEPMPGHEFRHGLAGLVAEPAPAWPHTIEDMGIA